VLNARGQLQAGPHPIGWQLGLAASTVHAILRRHGASRLNPTPPEPVIRYERARPGELLHIDIKRLGRIQRPHDPQTGRPYGAKGKAGWEYLFVCVDDHSRLAHARFYPAETTANALHFLNDCRRFYRQHGIETEQVLTDNGKCFQRTWKHRCRDAGITPLHTRIRRPQTNGKAERFIQTLLNGWIRPHTYTSNQHRTDALAAYLHFYNHQRRHRALNGLTPLQAVNNLPGTHNQVRFVNLEVVSECSVESAAEDEGEGELGEGEVELGSSFPAGADAAVVVQPGVRAFDRPAFGCLRVAGTPFTTRSFLDDPRFDPAFPQRGTDVLGVVAAVGEQPLGTFAPAAPQPGDRIDHGERVAAVVVVGGTQQDRERGAAAVAD
jgi:transposase InsO family protein